MKEIQIISKYKDIEILAQIFDEKIAMITDDYDGQRSIEENAVFFSDKDEYIFALFKVLKEVDKRGGFNHLKKDGLN